MNYKHLLLATAVAVSLSACGSSSKSNDEQKPAAKPAFDPSTVSFDAIATPITAKPAGVQTYEFTSAFDANKSSVSYTGQVVRQLLILDMNTKIKSYTTKNANATVKADMEFFMDDNGTTKIDDSLIVFKPKDSAGSKDRAKGSKLPGGTLANPTVVTKYGEISTGKKLRSKLAGEDKAEHLVGGKLIGWSEGMDADPTPSELINHFITKLEQEVKGSTQAKVPTIGGDVNVDVAFVDADGRDYTQLLQKVLWGAVAFSQGAADYLQTDFATKNKQVEKNGSKKPYTDAEHKWDEAFGYFGAAVNYDTYTLDEIASKKSKNDVDGSTSSVNLTSENNFHTSVNCAKREKAVQNAKFVKPVFNAFLAGRKVLAEAANSAPTNLTDAQKADVTKAAKQAALVWEQCIAATTIHYINDTNTSLKAFIEGQGKFDDIAAYRKLAKYWSEMKGFALNLQFNPISPFHKNADTLKVYEHILNTMGDKAKIGSAAEATQYREDLIKARDLLGKAYGFNTDDVKAW